jgi:putative ABC transport system substrate-binding protein
MEELARRADTNEANCWHAGREFIAGLGSAAVWPLSAHSQAAPPPVVGYLAQGTPEGSAEFVAAVRKGLGEAGLVEGKDFTTEFRWARFDGDQLPRLAADLVQRRVAVIITLDTDRPRGQPSR